MLLSSSALNWEKNQSPPAKASRARQIKTASVMNMVAPFFDDSVTIFREKGYSPFGTVMDLAYKYERNKFTTAVAVILFHARIDKKNVWDKIGEQFRQAEALALSMPKWRNWQTR